MNNNLTKRVLSSIVILPISFFFIFKGSLIFLLFLFLLYLISSQEWFRMVTDIRLKIIGLIFLFLSFYFTYLARTENLYFFLLITILCISTDLGCFICGKIFKGPKLNKISPNKTYSGMVGSFVFAVIISYSLYNLIDYELVFKKKIFFSIEFNFLLFVILISFISQSGDIFISYFKRKSKIKDTGKIFPGHGGLLDRIDGMIFAFPVAYFIYIISS